jgi:hypothetical protein
MQRKLGLTDVHAALLLSVLAAVSIGGCGGEASHAPTPPPVAFDREKLAAALPQGVTLETPVRPDKRYGESAKTVEDALKGLFATVKDGALYDLLEQQILFESPDKVSPKTAAKPTSAQTIVHLAK